MEDPPSRSKYRIPQQVVTRMSYYSDKGKARDGTETPLFLDSRTATIKHLQFILRQLGAVGSLSTYKQYTCRVKLAQMAKDPTFYLPDCKKTKPATKLPMKNNATTLSKENDLPRGGKKTGKDSPWSAEEEIYEKTLTAGKRHAGFDEKFDKFIKTKRMNSDAPPDSPEYHWSPKASAYKPMVLPESPDSSACSVALLSPS
jgi:hypothetical protein